MSRADDKLLTRASEVVARLIRDGGDVDSLESFPSLQDIDRAITVCQTRLDLLVSMRPLAGRITIARLPPIWEEFSTRTSNVLHRAGVAKVADLLGLSESNILELQGSSPMVLDEIRAVLSRHGLSLSTNGLAVQSG